MGTFTGNLKSGSLVKGSAFQFPFFLALSFFFFFLNFHVFNILSHSGSIAATPKCFVWEYKVKLRCRETTTLESKSSHLQSSFPSITAENGDDGADTSKGGCTEAFLFIFTTYPEYLALFTTHPEYLMYLGNRSRLKNGKYFP